MRKMKNGDKSLLTQENDFQKKIYKILKQVEHRQMSSQKALDKILKLC